MKVKDLKINLFKFNKGNKLYNDLTKETPKE